ncbi:uncharacterized protein LOC119371113 [Jatropha curcas]|uniref:uncharacterized protein LOC119371113 n=1 Tax=Jatropha curcas TaxID=180498 RepID=UPI00189386A2|nr:uncharacterized protein LOC119371113 [Jatropha curcas]
MSLNIIISHLLFTRIRLLGPVGVSPAGRRTDVAATVHGVREIKYTRNQVLFTPSDSICCQKPVSVGCVRLVLHLAGASLVVAVLTGTNRERRRRVTPLGKCWSRRLRRNRRKTSGGAAAPFANEGPRLAWLLRSPETRTERGEALQNDGGAMEEEVRSAQVAGNGNGRGRERHGAGGGGVRAGAGQEKRRRGEEKKKERFQNFLSYSSSTQTEEEKGYWQGGEIVFGGMDTKRLLAGWLVITCSMVALNKCCQCIL